MSDSTHAIPSRGPWWQQVTGYQWLVLLACYLGNLFDGLDSSLFHPIAAVAVGELLGTTDLAQVSPVSGNIVFCFLLGWAAGGFLFGLLGDRIGRAKALTLSILIYAIFTGLCGLAQTWEQLAVCRFMTALGIGGELIVGTTLLAETWSGTFRAKAVGFLTTAYQFGFFLAGLANQVVAKGDWRTLFFIGIAPAIMVFFIRAKVKEPEQWEKAHKREHAPISELFKTHYWVHVAVASTFTGTLLVAYWASTFWLASWVGQMVPGPEALPIKNNLIMINGAMAVVGAFGAGFLVDTIGRRWTVAIGQLGYLIATMGLFGAQQITAVSSLWDGLLGLFVGICIGVCYIYVPELFPTRLRTTGTGICFNIGRLVAALGALFSGHLIAFFGSYGKAACMISLILFAGMAVVWFAPETKGQPLPD